MTTVYRLVRQGEHARLHRLAADAGLDGSVYSYPTMVAERHGQLIGFAASRWWGERLVVGPVVIDPRVRLKGLVAVRTMLALEQVLKQDGRLYYLIGTADPAVQRLLEAWGCQAQGMHDGETWYLRQLRLEMGRVEK